MPTADVKRKRWTTAETEEAARLYKGGATGAEIGRILGRSKDAVYQQMRAFPGLLKGATWTSKSARLLADGDLTALLKAGHTYAQIKTEQRKLKNK